MDNAFFSAASTNDSSSRFMLISNILLDDFDKTGVLVVESFAFAFIVFERVGRLGELARSDWVNRKAGVEELATRLFAFGLSVLVPLAWERSVVRIRILDFVAAFSEYNLEANIPALQELFIAASSPGCGSLIF